MFWSGRTSSGKSRSSRPLNVAELAAQPNPNAGEPDANNAPGRYSPGKTLLTVNSPAAFAATVAESENIRMPVDNSANAPSDTRARASGGGGEIAESMTTLPDTVTPGRNVSVM